MHNVPPQCTKIFMHLLSLGGLGQCTLHCVWCGYGGVTVNGYTSYKYWIGEVHDQVSVGPCWMRSTDHGHGDRAADNKKWSKNTHTTLSFRSSHLGSFFGTLDFPV